MQEFIKELVLTSDSSHYRSSKIASSYPLLPSTVTNNKKVWVTPRPFHHSRADLGGGGVGGCAPTAEMTCGFLIRLVFCKKKKTMWFIGVEVQQEMSSPPPKKKKSWIRPCHLYDSNYLDNKLCSNPSVQNNSDYWVA